MLHWTVTQATRDLIDASHQVDATAGVVSTLAETNRSLALTIETLVRQGDADEAAEGDEQINGAGSARDNDNESDDGSDNSSASSRPIITIVPRPANTAPVEHRNGSAAVAGVAGEWLCGLFVPHDTSQLTSDEQEHLGHRVLEIAKRIGDLKESKRAHQLDIGNIDKEINRLVAEAHEGARAGDVGVAGGGRKRPAEGDAEDGGSPAKQAKVNGNAVPAGLGCGIS